MSFQTKGPWVLNDIGALSDGEMGSGTSLRIEQKRAHQFFMDASEGELFSIKKQALQSVTGAPISTPASVNFFCGNTSDFQSAPVRFSDRLCAPEPLGTFIFGDEDVFSLGNENVKSERSRFIDLQNNSTVSLSMSPAGKDPSYLNGGTKGARITLDGRECSSDYPFPLWNPSNSGEYSINAKSLGLSYRDGIGNVTLMGHNSAKGKEPASPIDKTINKVNGDCMLMGPQYSRGENNLMAQSQPYKNFISMFPSHGKLNEDLMPVGMTGNKDIGVASRIPANKVADDIISAGTCSKVSKEMVQKAPKSSSNNFPSHVKSLLSTGILDGVPVKYVSWAREKSVRGIIKGNGYLCGCNDCKFSKSVNAFEFERHAACKTRHPNNHIYFETGKSIYAVVQELKKTSPEMLFEAIQKISSPINQKNFQTWKASFQAANRELHQIYTKSEVAKPF